MLFAGGLAGENPRSREADFSYTWIFACTSREPLPAALFKGRLRSQEAGITESDLKDSEPYVRALPLSSTWHPGAARATTLETKCSHGARPEDSVQTKMDREGRGEWGG